MILFACEISRAAPFGAIKLLQTSGANTCAASTTEVKCWRLSIREHRYTLADAIVFNKRQFKKIGQLVVSDDAACVLADGEIDCGGRFSGTGDAVADELNMGVPNPIRITKISDSIGGVLTTRFCAMSAKEIHCEGSPKQLGPDSNGQVLQSSPFGPVGDFPYHDMVGIDGALCVAAKSGIFCWGNRLSIIPSIGGIWPSTFYERPPVTLFTSGDQLCKLDERGTARCWRWFDQLVSGDGKIRSSDGTEITQIQDINSDGGLCFRRGSGSLFCDYKIGESSTPRSMLSIDAVSSRWGMTCFANNDSIKCQPVVYDGLDYGEMQF